MLLIASSFTLSPGNTHMSCSREIFTSHWNSWSWLAHLYVLYTPARDNLSLSRNSFASSCYVSEDNIRLEKVILSGLSSRCVSRGDLPSCFTFVVICLANSAEQTENQAKETPSQTLRPNPHRTRDRMRAQIGMFFLWCCLWAVWTPPFTSIGPICLCPASCVDWA